jgi:hypothetical protein
MSTYDLHVILWLDGNLHDGSVVAATKGCRVPVSFTGCGVGLMILLVMNHIGQINKK